MGKELKCSSTCLCLWDFLPNSLKLMMSHDTRSCLLLLQNLLKNNLSHQNMAKVKGLNWFNLG